VASPTLLRGDPVAEALTERVRERLARLDSSPTLATVLMSDDDADRRFVDLKHERCAAVGVETRDVEVPTDAPAERLSAELDRLAADADVTAVFVQVPLPDHVDLGAVRARLPPAKDVDCFSPARLGALAAGTTDVKPATTAAVRRLLAHHDVSVAGRDVVLVGRNPAVGRPLAADLLAADPAPDSVTVCHSRTRDLGAHTRRADLLVTAAGVPRLVTESMVSAGAVVVDVSANRVDGETVGDVDFDAVAPVADAITPVPGGVGPVTLAALLWNVAVLAGDAQG
jgi:methylenetetrahydrofolate dehydrogenase (NADP+)/methenyltetrahydrofolate cyclohydrolase